MQVWPQPLFGGEEVEQFGCDLVGVDAGKADAQFGELPEATGQQFGQGHARSQVASVPAVAQGAGAVLETRYMDGKLSDDDVARIADATGSFRRAALTRG